MKSTKRNEQGHYCEVKKEDENWQEIAFGSAINTCYEDIEGRLIAHNGEYGNTVNFCPFCGHASKHPFKY